MLCERGFTLVEIIAVLLIIGIMAAIAVPKYMDVAAQAKNSAAKSELEEMKSSLNMAYAKYFMSNGAMPTEGSQVIAMAGFIDGAPANVGNAPDVWNVTLKGSGKTVHIIVNSYGETADQGFSATGTWNIPHQ